MSKICLPVGGKKRQEEIERLPLQVRNVRNERQSDKIQPVRRTRTVLTADWRQ